MVHAPSWQWIGSCLLQNVVSRRRKPFCMFCRTASLFLGGGPCAAVAAHGSGHSRWTLGGGVILTHGPTESSWIILHCIPIWVLTNNSYDERDDRNAAFSHNDCWVAKLKSAATCDADCMPAGMCPHIAACQQPFPVF
eukprot:359501-Chlamydomonas_euryale.AAC.7